MQFVKTFEGVPAVDKNLLYVLKSIEFIMNPFLPFLIIQVFRDNNSYEGIITWIQRVQKGIIIVNFPIQVAASFGNFMFIIDATNIYHRTKITYIYVIFLVFSIALMIFALNIFSRKVQSTNQLTLCGLCIMLCTGFALRIINTNANFDWLCIAISMFVIDIYYVNLSLRLDPLTKLLNRQVYESIIEKINYSTVIIMIDANNFKAINDTYGHECGDKTLKQFAKCILKAYSNYGWCCRIGGDEFCVILKPQEFKKLVENTQRCDVYVMSERLMDKLDEIIKEQEAKDEQNFLQYGVSQGYGVYYSPSDYPTIKNNMPLNNVIRLADMRMYRQKKKFKENLAETVSPEEQEKIESDKKRRGRVVYNPKNPEFIEDSVQE